MKKTDYEKPALKDIKNIAHGICTAGSNPSPSDPECTSGSRATSNCHNGNVPGAECDSGNGD